MTDAKRPIESVRLDGGGLMWVTRAGHDMCVKSMTISKDGIVVTFINETYHDETARVPLAAESDGPSEK